MSKGGRALPVYTDLFHLLWLRMVDMVGIHTVTLLAQRAAWMTRQKHSQAAAIAITDGGIDLSQLEDAAGKTQAEAIAEEFLASLVDILTRLLGEKIARKLSQELDAVVGKEAADRA